MTEQPGTSPPGPGQPEPGWTSPAQQYPPYPGQPFVPTRPATPPGPKRRRVLFWTGAVLALAALVGGVVVAVQGYSRTSGAAGAVRGYYAALARGDASAALAFGETPQGVRTYLTGTVLAEQRRLAPMGTVRIVSSVTSGDTASFHVQYALQFPNDSEQVSDTVGLHRRGGDWKLDAVAVATKLQMTQAAQRATVLGTAVPTGAVLLFPGAVPVDFDTPYLQLTAPDDTVSFQTGPVTDVLPAVSPAGRTAAVAALRSALTTCLNGSTDPTCPQPNGARVVPGTVKATVSGDVDSELSVAVGDDKVGTLIVTGAVSATGTYRALSFDNQPTDKTGDLTLGVGATMYAVAPLTVRWGTS